MLYSFHISGKFISSMPFAFVLTVNIEVLLIRLEALEKKVAALEKEHAFLRERLAKYENCPKKNQSLRTLSAKSLEVKRKGMKRLDPGNDSLPGYYY